MDQAKAPEEGSRLLWRLCAGFENRATFLKKGSEFALYLSLDTQSASSPQWRSRCGRLDGTGRKPRPCGHCWCTWTHRHDGFGGFARSSSAGAACGGTHHAYAKQRFYLGFNFGETTTHVVEHPLKRADSIQEYRGNVLNYGRKFLNLLGCVLFHRDKIEALEDNLRGGLGLLALLAHSTSP